MLLSTFAAGPATRVRAIGRYALLAACLLLLAADVISPDCVAWFKSWDTGVLHPAAPNGSEGNYQLAQASVLPGKTILNLTAVPFYFDFARNPIFGLDWPGMASPPPGLPLGRGPEALRDYLRAQSIDYLICNDFDAMTHRSMASRPFMKERRSRPADYDLHVLTDQRIIPTVLQTMADIDALAQLNPPIYHENRLRVIPIAAPKSASDGGSPK